MMMAITPSWVWVSVFGLHKHEVTLVQDDEEEEEEEEEGSEEEEEMMEIPVQKKVSDHITVETEYTCHICALISQQTNTCTHQVIMCSWQGPTKTKVTLSWPIVFQQ